MDDELDMVYFERMSRPEIIADIVENTRSVVPALEIQRDPDVRTNRHFFSLDDKNYRLPPSILSWIDAQSTIDDMAIEFSQDLPEGLSSLSLTFSLETPSGEPVSIFVTRAKDSDSVEYIARMLVAEDESPIELPNRVPASELSALFASIFAPNKNGDYSPFHSLDHTDPTILKNLNEAIEKYADDSMCHAIYHLHDKLKNKTGAIEYDTENDNFSNITIRHDLKSGRATALSVGVGDHQTRHHDSSDTSDLEGIRVYELNEQGISHEIDATTGEILVFDEFLKQVKQSLATASITELLVDNFDEVSSNQTIRHRQSHEDDDTDEVEM